MPRVVSSSSVEPGRASSFAPPKIVVTGSQLVRSTPMKVSRTASRRRASVTSRMTTIVSPPLGGLPTPTLTGYVDSSIHRSGSSRVGISTGPASTPSGDALPSASLSCSRIWHVRSSTSGKRRFTGRVRQRDRAVSGAHDDGLAHRPDDVPSSAARACSACARRWSRTWTSIRSRTSRAIATMARELPGRSTAWRTTSTAVGRPWAGR